MGSYFARDPYWLKPLKEADVFKNPSDIIQHEDWIEIPSWGPSQYLVKIAKQFPVEVSKIIQLIPETCNFKIYEDYIDAALEMPLDQAKTIVKKIMRFLSNPFQFNISNKLCELGGRPVSHLSRPPVPTHRALLKQWADDQTLLRWSFANA